MSRSSLLCRSERPVVAFLSLCLHPLCENIDIKQRHSLQYVLCWVEGGPLKPTFGFPAFSGIARLTWLVELFGNLSATAATLEEDPEQNYFKMTARLKTSSDR